VPRCSLTFGNVDELKHLEREEMLWLILPALFHFGQDEITAVQERGEILDLDGGHERRHRRMVVQHVERADEPTGAETLDKRRGEDVMLLHPLQYRGTFHLCFHFPPRLVGFLCHTSHSAQSALDVDPHVVLLLTVDVELGSLRALLVGTGR
jgi:hypothetical protein